MKGIIFLLFPALFGSQLLSMGIAQSPQSISYDAQVQHQALTGKVIYQTGNVIKVQNQDQVTQLVMPLSYSFQKDLGFQNNSKLEVGDQVKMEINQVGQIAKVTAYSNEFMNLMHWSLPAMLSGFGFLFIGLKLWRKYASWKSLHYPIHIANI